MRSKYIAGIAALALFAGCKDSGDRKVYELVDLVNSTEWVANCDLMKNHGFVMECHFSNGRAAYMKDCDFQKADYNDEFECDPYIYICEKAIYQGQDALQRAKEDFDACTDLRGITFSGYIEVDEVKNEIILQPAISPYTLKQATCGDLQKLANHFSEQKVAGWTSHFLE